MTVIRCKICGGDMEISNTLNFWECEYCGTKYKNDFNDNIHIAEADADDERKLAVIALLNILTQRARMLEAANAKKEDGENQNKEEPTKGTICCGCILLLLLTSAAVWLVISLIKFILGVT